MTACFSFYSNEYCVNFGYFGGSGGTPFTDPCIPHSRINQIIVGIGQVGGCAQCVRFFAALYKYVIMHNIMTCSYILLS